jgi:putative polyhydroxyalkanoate system protein
MPTINLRRDHNLGIARARQLAAQWSKQVEKDFDMTCANAAGKTEDVVSFKRSGVDGRLVVAADRFELEAKLGLLLGAFTKTIQQQIENNLDALLSAETKSKPAGAAAKTKPKAGK